MISLKPITSDSSAALKLVRLAALKDSPFAFGSTFEKESLLTDAEWQQRAAERNGERSITFLAWDDELACGIASGFLNSDDPGKAAMTSFWVAPTHRRSGIGRRLTSAIAEWAKSRDAAALYLMVTSNNAPALRFYERLNFKSTGRIEPYPNDPAVVEYEMLLVL